jgi:hypothetical protein
MIKTRQLVLIILLFATLPVSFVYGQSAQAGNDPKIEEVKSLTQFFEYMLNTVGSKTTSQRDKEVIINQSYQKVFLSNKVQVEDDLLDERKVITNKDITGYLRDVDFFFTNISFVFSDIQIKKEEKPNGEPYYLVSFENRIQGTSSDGEQVNKTQKRFLEVNYDAAKNDLKIVSVYTTKLTRKKELEAWWSSLSYDWIAIFQNHEAFEQINDTVIEQVADLDSLNLAGHAYLTDLAPLSMLKKLKYLDVSETRVSDLRPIRFATELRTLKANSTPVTDIDVVSYFPMLKKLELSHTEVEDIRLIASLSKLEHLDVSSARIGDFSALSNLTNLSTMNLANSTFADLTLIQNNLNLRELNVSRTNVSETTAFSDLKKIQVLDLSETGIGELDGLKKHPSLSILYMNQTSVNSLSALNGIASLKKVFADYSKVTPEEASFFMKKNPSVLVISNSGELLSWWGALSPNWKAAFTPLLDKKLDQKEALIKLLNSDSLNLSGFHLSGGMSLKIFKRLHYLDISENDFNSFDFTADMPDLSVLIGNRLPVTNTVGLEQNMTLVKLSLRGTSLTDIEGVQSLPKLKVLDIEGAQIPEESILTFIRSTQGTIVIYRSEELKNWWEGLQDGWKAALKLEKTDSYSLHELTQNQSLSIEGMRIQDLAPLRMFVNLQALSLNQVNVSNFEGLAVHKNLKSLSCTNGPLISITGLAQLQQLEEINVTNTAIADLSELRQNTGIKRLNCSGTNVKKLRGVEYLKAIEFLDISNTGIFSLDRLHEMKGLKKIICYNTRIRDYEVEKFRTLAPDCEIIFY